MGLGGKGGSQPWFGSFREQGCVWVGYSGKRWIQRGNRAASPLCTRGNVSPSPPRPGFPQPRGDATPPCRAGRKRRPLTQSPGEISSCAGLRTRMIWPHIIQVARHTLLPSTLISRCGQSEEGGCTSPGGREGSPQESPAAPG